MSGSITTSQIAPPPTPEEIRQACAEIQAGWSPEEELRRRVVPASEWEPPQANRKKLRSVIGNSDTSPK